MDYRFAKLHGAGNDFIMIEDLANELTITPEQVRALCDRHFGVGADGVILVKPSFTAGCVAFMDYYNSDGTKAQMCGNGVRCFAKFLVDRGFVDRAAGSFIADTSSGPREIAFTLGKDCLLESATVDMGAPILEPPFMPTTLEAADTEFGKAVIDTELEVDGQTYRVTCVSMGNPHAVIFVDDPDEVDVETIGPLLESCEVFPEKANIEFAHVEGNKIAMRIWERGCGETLGCGTGACATAVAAVLTGQAPRRTTIQLKGGNLDINFNEDDGHVYMTGPAVQTFYGNVAI